MYTLDGIEYSIEEIQEAASQSKLSVDEYISQYGITKIEDPVEIQEPSLTLDDLMQGKINPTDMDAAVEDQVVASDMDLSFEDTLLASQEITDAKYSSAEPEEKIKLLKNQYEPLGFTVDKDNNNTVNISNNKGQSQVFNLKEQRGNQGTGQNFGAFDQPTSISPLESIKDFVADNQPESLFYKDIYKETKQLPDNYASLLQEVESGPLTVKDFVELEDSNIKATAKEQLNLINTTKGLITRAYEDASSVGLGTGGVGSEGYDEIIGKYEEQVKEEIFKQLGEKTKLDINFDDFNAIYNQVKESSVVDAKTLIQQKQNLIKASSPSPGFEVFKQKFLQTRIDAETPKSQERIRLLELKSNANKQIEGLNVLYNNAENLQDKEAHKKNILLQQDVIKSVDEKIQRNAQTPQINPYGVAENFDEEIEINKQLSNSVFSEEGDLEAKEQRKKVNRVLAKGQVNQIKLNQPNLSDWQATRNSFDQTVSSIQRLQSDASDQYITVNIESLNATSSAQKLKSKFNKAGYFGDKEKVSLLTLNQLGITYKDLNDTVNFGLAEGDLNYKKSVEEDDLVSVEMYEETLKEKAGIAQSLFELSYKETDPANVEKPGFVKNLVQTAVVETVKKLGFTEKEAEKLSTLGQGPRSRVVLDRLNEAAAVAGLGENPWTEEQANNIEKVFSEQVSEGVGGFVPIMAELAAMNLVTGGTLGITGATKVLTNLKSQGLYGKTLYHAIMAMIEEGKLQTVGFKPGGGVAFYTIGKATSGIKQPFGKTFNFLNPILEKVIKAGPVGAASLEIAQVSELAYDSFMGNADFKKEFDKNYGDLEDVTKRMLVNMFVFSIAGTGHLKANDMMSTQMKSRAIKNIQETQDKLVSGAEVVNKFGKKSEVTDVGGATTKKETYDIDGKSVSKEVFDQYTALQDAKKGLVKQVYLEADFVKLDPKSKNFESDLSSMVTNPINAAIKAIVPGYEGFVVKTGEGKNFTQGFKDKKAVAEFQAGKDGSPDVVLLDTSRPDLIKKAMHEMSHASLKAYFSNPANSNQKRNFIKDLSEIFSDVQIPTGDVDEDNVQTGKTITGKEFGKEVDKVYNDKDFQTKQEEFLTNIIEQLSDPIFYFTEVAPTVVSELKLKLKDFFLDNGINAPQPKTAQQLVNALSNVGFQARRGNLSVNNAKTLAKLGDIDLLGIEYVEGKQDLSSQSSREISVKNKEIAEKNLKITEGKEILTQADKDALVEINMLKARELTNKAVRTGNNIGLEKEKQVRPEDWLSGYTERLIKLTNTYDPSLGVPFGAYMNKNLPLEYQSILKKYATNIKTQTLEGKEVGSIINEKSSTSGFDTQDLSPGKKTTTEKKLLEPTEVLIKDLENQERELQLIENTIDKDLFVKKGEEKVFIDLTGKNIKNLKPSTKLIEEITQVFSKGGSIKFKDGKPLLKDGKTVSDQAGNVANQKEYIRERAEELFELINKAARKKPEGLSTATGIANSLLGPLFEKGARADVVDGTTAGLSKQKKLEWNPKTEKIFLEIFGAQENAPKLKTSSTEYKNQVTKINALIREIAKVSLNRRARVLGEKIGADIETLQRLADGKSDSAASRPLELLYKDVLKEFKKRKTFFIGDLQEVVIDNTLITDAEKIKALKAIDNLKIFEGQELFDKVELNSLLEQAADRGITTAQAQLEILETAVKWKQFLAAKPLLTSKIKRIDRGDGKKVDEVGKEWIEGGKVFLKDILPKGEFFKDQPVEFKNLIASELQFGNTKLYINTGKGKSRPLTKLAFATELTELLKSQGRDLGKIGETAKNKGVPGNSTKADLIDIVFGKIKGTKETISASGELVPGYKNDLNESKQYSTSGASAPKTYLKKLVDKGLSREEIKRDMDLFLAKNKNVDATYNINKEILLTRYDSYANQVSSAKGKKAQLEALGIVIDAMKPLTNQATSISKQNVNITSFNIKPEKGSTKNKDGTIRDKVYHNEHQLQFFQMNKGVVENLLKAINGKITFKKARELNAKNVGEAQQAIISERVRETLQDATGPSVRDFVNQFVFQGPENAKNQILVGNQKGNNFTIAEKLYNEVNTKEIKEIISTSDGKLTPLGVILKQRLQNPKEFKKVEVINKRIADKAGIDAKDLNNTDILQRLKEKDKINQEELIESYASRDLDLAFNEIIEIKTGIGKEKTYSKAKAAVVGTKAGKVKLIASSAQDFEGLMYRTLGKGKVGDTQKKFYEEFLYRPLAQAEANLATDRVTMANNFKALKKQLKVSPKDLRKNIEKGEPWSKEQAVRVHIWNKQGMTVPDLSKADLKLLDKFVKSDPKLEAYAQELILLGKGTPYAEPGRNWEVGTITSDLIKSIQTTKRSEYLAPFISNADIMFNEKNLNKLEAGFGIKYREALENSLARIKAGKNRLFFNSDSGSALENRVLDYINNSTGAIMFFNTRSAVLQTISAANFLNFKENNPLAAGIAFANQPQYWKDFSKLMNSDYLVDRRQGVKLNVAEAEIADAVHDQTNKPKAALNYILRKGFLPTQFADSFAIASGGATYYRNRVKMYEKEGLSTKEAEKKAYLDFMDTAEKSQQSSKAQRISMQQASNLGRVVLAFANTPSQYLRLTQKATSDLLNNRGSKTENISKIAYYSLVQNLLFTTLQHATVGLLFDEEEDNKAQAKEKIPNVLSSMFDNLARGAGVAGAGVVTAKAIAMKIHEESKKKRSNYSDVAYELLTFSPPIRSKVLKLRSAGRTYDWNKKEIKEMGFDLKNPAYLAGANVVSAFTNVPLDRVVKKANNLRGAMDEQNALWQRIALSMGWNRYELGLPYETYKTENKKSGWMNIDDFKSEKSNWKNID